MTDSSAMMGYLESVLVLNNLLNKWCCVVEVDRGEAPLRALLRKADPVRLEAISKVVERA